MLLTQIRRRLAALTGFFGALNQEVGNEWIAKNILGSQSYMRGSVSGEHALNSGLPVTALSIANVALLKNYKIRAWRGIVRHTIRFHGGAGGILVLAPQKSPAGGYYIVKIDLY